METIAEHDTIKDYMGVVPGTDDIRKKRSLGIVNYNENGYRRISCVPYRAAYTKDSHIIEIFYLTEHEF